VFGVSAASRNTRFQAARYGLTWAGLAPADRASFSSVKEISNETRSESGTEPAQYIERTSVE
jgi:hypothetical protein